MTVAMVVVTTIYHAMQESSDKTAAVCILSNIILCWWIFRLVVTRTILVNQLLPDAPVSSLSELLIPLHAHFTSALGPYYWLTFAIYKDLHINKKSM